METELVVVLLLGPVVTAVLAAFSRAAALGRIPRNHLAGIRVPSTLASDGAWRAGHRAAVRPSCWWFAVLVAADVAALAVPWPTQQLPVVGLIVLTAVALAWVLVTAVRAARAV